MTNIHTHQEFDMGGEIFEYTVYEDGMAEAKATDLLTGETVWSDRTKNNWGIDLARSWALGAMRMRYDAY